jgi:hypothetical protein
MGYVILWFIITFGMYIIKLRDRVKHFKDNGAKHNLAIETTHNELTNWFWICFLVGMFASIILKLIILNYTTND